MAEGVDATSFEFYEGIRIILPGALTVGLADAVVRTASADGAGLGLDALPAVVAAILIGLAFHFIDAPAKATAYRTGLPTEALADFGEPRVGKSVANSYFVILDDDMPPGIKARALYMGSMYRIGYEATFLLIVTSTVVLSQALWTRRSIRIDPGANPGPMWIALGALGGAWAFALYAHRMTASRRQATHRQGTEPLPNDWKIDSGVTFVAASVLVMVFLAATVWDVARWPLLIPIAIELLHWTYRYSKGYPKSADDRMPRRLRRFWSQWRLSRFKELPPAVAPARRRANAVEATRHVALAGAFLLIALVGAPIHTGWLDRTELLLWLITLVLGVVLVVARGHEVKLGGAYATQRTWLLLNKDKLVEKYCIPPTDETDGQDS